MPDTAPRPDAQSALPIRVVRNRGLLSDHFLQTVLPEWHEFKDVDVDSLLAELRDLWAAESTGLAGANESQTEERFIRPVLRLLGFDFTVQVNASAGHDRRRPDYALFTDGDARRRADAAPEQDRFREAVAVCDAKRFNRDLDKRSREGALSEDPVAQILHYLWITKTRWGILTNGRLWRLFGAEGDRAEGSWVELDLVALLDSGDPRAFRYFACLFRVDSFKAGADGRSLNDRILDGSRDNAIAVGNELRTSVLGALPTLAEGLLRTDERSREDLDLAFENALVLLYRLLFCLYAEARGQLPIEQRHYQPHSLQSIRREVATMVDEGRRLSDRSARLYDDVRALFALVDSGDADLGINEYNGGLFSATAHSWLAGRSITDRKLAPALDRVFRIGRQQVDFRQLSVRHLGTIFERLLAFRLNVEDGELKMVAAPGRKVTGAWFTPDFIVDEIVERTLTPTMEQRSRRVAESGLEGRAALDELLDVHVLDPAIGSGHFLVGAAAFIARWIANDPSFDGPESIVELQGIVAERCLYGVDVNPLAVEIARLSLWLLTARNDRPLCFLDQLRVGNSLVAADASLLISANDLLGVEVARTAAAMLERIGQLAATDTLTADDARQQEQVANTLEATRAPLRDLANAAVAPPIAVEDGKPLHWELEFPDRFLTADGGLQADPGFDVVLGNPPYVKIQQQGRGTARHVKESGRYGTVFGAFDAYVPFIEMGLRLLRRHGRLGYIVPSRFLKVDYGRRLRALLARDHAVEQIIDFGDAQIFDDATNYTCVLVLDRRGQPEVRFRAVSGTSTGVRQRIADGQLPAAESYPVGELGTAPWVLVPGRERAILDTMARGSASLGEVTAGIFTGLQTSADDIYILEDLGMRAGLRRVRTRAGDQLELEDALLHPLASGPDVEPYAFRRLRALLLFPYERGRDGITRLLSERRMQQLPATWGYLTAHEAALRARERGKMDRDGWWAFGRTQSLGNHVHAKLGVPRLVSRLNVAADLAGDVYLDNVDVNGILPRAAGPTLQALSALLNSTAVDFAFRSGSVRFANGFYGANKQFIAPLPVPAELPAELHNLGAQLCNVWSSIHAERGAYLAHLGSVIGADPYRLPGTKTLRDYDLRATLEVLAVLDRSRSRLGVDPSSRRVRDALVGDLEASVATISQLRRIAAGHTAVAEDVVTDAYGLTRRQRALIDADYA